jgi:uncharacterized protein (DUF885 family)
MEQIMTSRIAMLVAAGLAFSQPVLAQQQPARGQAPAELVQLAQAFRTARRTFSEEGDFSAKAATTRATQLADFRARLEKLPRASWPIADQVDWYVLRTELNQLDFDQRIRKASSRDPGFYVQQAVGAVPQDIERVSAEQATAIATRLAKVPALFDQAKRNLTEGSRIHGELALRDIEEVRGVRVQQSGLQRLQSLSKASTGKYPEVAKAADGAARALAEFASWIRTSAPTWKAPGHIGLDNFNWYLQNVMMMPFTADELLSLAERDLSRTVANLAYEENRNRNLPPLLPAATAEDYARRVTEADRLTRTWLKEGNILTVPEDTPPTPATVPWQEGGTQVTPTHYWQAIQFRDPLPDHLHAGIPGHRYDGMVMRRNPRPIRAGHSDRGRSEGWGFYLEEMALMAGLLDERPRTRELFHNFQLFRYVRMMLDIKMAAGEMTPAQAVAYQKHWVPMMEDQVAWSEGASYYVTPSAGTAYPAGKYQIEMLVANLRRQLGTKFDLRAFHDRFMEAGPIPIVLIEWELTGDDSALKRVESAATATRASQGTNRRPQ